MSKSLRQDLSRCQISDQHRLRRQLDKLSKDGAGREQALAQIRRRMQDSIAACERRAASIPALINYPEQLPVSGRAEDIARLIREHPVVIVAGDTGSGKTTQLPKICLEAGYGRRGLIGHTQPRRLAAISVTDRITEELQSPAQNAVAYQVRFDDKSTPETVIKLMTDGIMLAEIQRDRFLNRYEVIIVDEAHERSLNIDFLLGFLKQLQTRRRDLKLVITSATIDVEKFSSHFNGAPVVSVEGRTYPVATRYAPLVTQDTHSDSSEAQLEGILQAIDDIAIEDARHAGAKDVLVFLSSEREIRETALALRKRRLTQTEVLPLYARLRHSEQVKIFKPHSGRRIVLATNVAETSITVPGIRYVIDTGCARISRYSLQSKVQRLPIEAISQASANQRKGRCGRVQDGVCIRLYSQSDFESRPLYTDPEIKRTNLASVILRMRFLRLGDVEDFPFLEAPETRAINEGFKLLFELSALNQKRELTAAGKQMAVLPIDPRYGRMLVTANLQRCLREVLIIVSALSIQDPRELASDTRQQALEKLEFLNHRDSDFLGFVNLWNEYEQRRQQLSQGQLRKYCRQHFLSYMRMREWREVHRQLLLACQQLGFKLNKDPADYPAVHKSIISGSLNQIASRFDGKTYLGNRNRKFTLLGSSVLAGKPPKWIVTGDQVETSQTFASMAATVEPGWVEEMAMHLVKREYFEPHWSEKRQQVMAYEKVQLYGLVIIEKSPVTYDPIDKQAARSIFIKDGLAGDRVATHAPFLKRNHQFLRRMAKQEEKLRRPDLIVSERDVVNFYEERIPAEVSSTRQLESWLGRDKADAAGSMLMDEQSLLRSDTMPAQIALYPDQAAIQQNRLRIDYRFEPGSARDGATLEVPQQILPQLTQADIDWAVPGMIRERCIAWLKGLPKAQRKRFIPIPGFVDAALCDMSAGDGDLLAAFLAQIRSRKGIRLEREDFQQVDIADHLRIKLRVVDERGREVFLGNSLTDAQQQLGCDAPDDVSHPARFGHELEADGLTEWTFPDLPVEVNVGDDLVLRRYPALIDTGDAVSIKLLADQQEAIEASADGVLRLYMVRTSQQLGVIRKSLQRFTRSHALLIPVPPTKLIDHAVRTCYREAFAVADKPVRTRQAFDARLQRGRAELVPVCERLESLLLASFQSRHSLLIRLQELEQHSSLTYLIDDVRAQMDSLMSEDFIQVTALHWLRQYPRYLLGIESRLTKAPHVGARDREHTDEIASLWRRMLEQQDRATADQRAVLEQLRWMIEEYRVSLFAQSLGTSMPVSAKRIAKQFDRLVESGN